MDLITTVIFWLIVITLPAGIIMTIISWTNDSARLEKAGIYTSLVDAVLLVLSVSACTYNMFNSW